MPSFLTKVFGRKKDERDTTSTPTANSSLLEGKYEAVSPPNSPSAVQFAGSQSTQSGPVKESSLALFRSRSRTVDKQQPSNLASASAPHLTLNLPVPKEEKTRALGVVFEADPDSSSLISDEVVGERRLSPLEALLLVKACSSAIAERGGLESLGLMHPHWYSASPEIQRKLISLFILSLGPKSPITTLSPTPASPSTIFETELSYTRDPHDIASVLRWGVRHLRLEGSSFGKDTSSSEWSWYQTFATSERDANYPPRAFSQSLVPLLPPAHLQLLTALLDIMSSLAAHGEAIGTSGSKLSKLFGLWLVSAERAKASEDWAEFYKRWEQAGRIFEHLFLAYIREEDSGHKMPLRLSELVQQYPYHSEKTASSSSSLPLLPIPRFSTRRRDALFIRVDTLLPTPSSPRPSREHPLRLISEAFKVSVASDATIVEGANAIWEELKAKASEAGGADGAYPALSKILDDETMRLLSLIPADQSSPLASPLQRSVATSSPSSPLLNVPESPARTRSASVGNPNGDIKTNGHNGTASSLTNWTDFSTTGFGDSSIGLSLNLAASEAAKTSPSQPSSRRPSPPRGRSTTLDTHTRKPTPPQASNPETKPKSTVKSVELVQVDEAFFDFWSDALLDPIAADWPTFVVCQLKDSPSKASLLVIEQTISRPTPPPMPPMPSVREASPRPSMSASVGGGRKSFTFSPTIKRFSFFNSQQRADTISSGAKKTSIKSATKSPRIGEMGEILPEEVEPRASRAQLAAPEPAKPVQGLGLTTVEEKAVPSAPPKVESALPAVPLVEAPAPDVPAEVAPVATEAVKTESEAPEKPTVPVPENPEDVVVPTDDVSLAAGSDSTEKALPPAPEPVVLTGGTPGPEVALSSSEPAAIAHAAETAQAEGTVGAEPESSQTASSTEDRTIEDSTLDVEPHTSGGAVASAFTEHLDSSDEIPPTKSTISQPEPTIEEEIAAEAGAEFSEPIPEPAVLKATVAVAEAAGATTADAGKVTLPVAETVTHDTVPELDAKGEAAANGNGSSHAADDTQANSNTSH